MTLLPPARLNQVAISVSDRERSLAFYRDLLGLTHVGGTRFSGKKTQQVQGMALAVVERGQVVKVSAYGKRNVAQDLPLTPDTVMYGASLTKTVLAYTALQPGTPVQTAGGQQFAAGGVRHRALGVDQRPLVRPLVDDLAHPRAPDHFTLGRHRPVQPQTLFAMHQPHPVDTGGRVLDPHAGVAQHHRQRRQRQQVFLVDEAQLGLVGRVGAQADAERIEHGALLRVAMVHVLERPGHQLVVIDCHGVAQL